MVKLLRKIETEELPESVREIPPDLNPLEGGIFMQHQIDWVADESALKLCEKGRRTGITWAEAHDDCLIAAEEDGDNVFYIGDTKDKGLEWIGYVAHFANFIDQHRPDIWEAELELEAVNDNGDRVVERVAAYVVRFASGKRCAALASRPAVIRGLQGVVVIDEAAFHINVQGVIDACNALLIWGGKIRIISTHNGNRNAFNELVIEARRGENDYSLHRYTFDDAVANGLYERYCLKNAIVPTVEGKAKWYRKIRGSYGKRLAAMKQELDAIPAEGEGRLLSIVKIEACMTPDYVVKRWSPDDDGFVDWPQEARRATIELWLEREIAPILATMPKRAIFAIGGDFGLRQDRSVFPIGYTAQDLVRHVPLIIELWRVPYDQQKQVLFYVLDRLGLIQQVILDANGNGMVLAQETRQKIGADNCLELIANDAWYREHSPKFQAAFDDGMILIGADKDVREDLQLIENIDGVGKIPANERTASSEESGGGKRHGDAAVGLMNFYAATLADVAPIEFQSVGQPRAATSIADFLPTSVGRPRADDYVNM